MRAAWIWAVFAGAVLGCHEEGSGCHWPWERDNLLVGAQHGEPCDGTDDCAGNLVCSSQQTCELPGAPGALGQGDPCPSTEHCAHELVCDADGVCAPPGDPGTASLGEACDDAADCQLGLRCVEEACHGLQLPLWLGAQCPEEETGPFRGLFDLRGVSGDDFYRAPFPNDARVRTDGTLDLSDHPSPGMLLPELGDVVGAVFDTVSQDFAGFGPNQAVFFRFSGRLDYDTLARGLPHQGGTWNLVDVTPGETFGEQVGGGFRTATVPGAYICANWFAIAPATGRPLRAGHTYVAFLGADLRDEAGTAPVHDPDFSAMLDPSAPDDAALTTAWQSFAPLRAWIDDTEGLDGDDLAVATVFTVQDPVEPARALRAAVHQADLPVASDWWQCGSVGSGPFADGDGRGCFGATATFHELQGRITLPAFQEGTAPYKVPRHGGAIAWADGVPVVQDTASVHFTLTVPKGATMPEAGWPLVIYGHGTGGSYTSAVREGLAAALAEVHLDDDTIARFATLTIDAPLHGPRANPEAWDDAWLAIDPGAYEPDVLFFNPLNPRSTRDNALQSAADHWALTRWARALDLSADDSPTGAAIRLDPDALYYLGHSQGGTTGVAFVAHEPHLHAAALSGAGGLLIESLLGKSSPYDVAAAVAVGLADPDLDRFHPVLNLVQGGAERADAVNHAPHVQHAPLADDPARHVLQTFGVGDTYTPDTTQLALVRSLRLQQVPGDNPALEGVPTVELPASGNRAGTTAITVLYAAPDDRDPHFVLFDRDDTLRAVTHFFGTAWRDGVPTVVSP